jgi:uncharacterized cupin superfamily protein
MAALEVIEAPYAKRLPAVTHHDADASIQVLYGIVYVISEDDEWVLTPGGSATIRAGRAYRRWNAGDDDARWVEILCDR